ncbi:MAG: DUF6046 domain-containing protein [Nitrosomonadaceae bacterium]
MAGEVVRTAKIIKNADEKLVIRTVNLQAQAGSFVIKGAAIQKLKADLFNLTPNEGDVPDIQASRYLGTPVYSALGIPSQTYTDLDGQQITTQNLTIETVLMTVSQTKNIITTAIQGRNGTVKEYISDGDYQIEIRGVIASGAGDVYPENEVTALVEICRAPVAIEIFSEFMDFFEIDTAVVESYDFPQVEGFRDNQPFTIRLLSDVPIELNPAVPQQDLGVAG